jgi:hypothetical protein
MRLYVPKMMSFTQLDEQEDPSEIQLENLILSINRSILYHNTQGKKYMCMMINNLGPSIWNLYEPLMKDGILWCPQFDTYLKGELERRSHDMSYLVQCGCIGATYWIYVSWGLPLLLSSKTYKNITKKETSLSPKISICPIM